MHVTPEQAALVKAVRNFVNLPRLRSVAQVYAVFRPWSEAWPRLPERDLPALKRDQRRVRSWLAGILEGGDRFALARIDVRNQLATVRVGYDMERDRVVHVLTGVEAACAMGAAWILSRELGLRGRLARCKAPLPRGLDEVDGRRRCGRFVLTFEGRARRYCTAEHRRLFDAADAARRIAKARAAGASY
jgi:hypothetical protein